MAAVETWQDAVTAALGERGIRGLGAIAVEALEAELPLLRDEPDLAEAARASVLATWRSSSTLRAARRRWPTWSHRRRRWPSRAELARRNVPVAELDRAYRVAQHALWRWAVAEVHSRISDPAAVAAAVEALSEGAFTTGDVLTSVVMARYAVERELWVRSADAVRKATVDGSSPATPSTSTSRRDGWGTSCASRTRPSSSGPTAPTPYRRPPRSPSGGGGRCSSRWASTSSPAGPPRVDEAMAASSGVAVALGHPGSGAAGFRQSHREAMEARRVRADPASARRARAL